MKLDKTELFLLGIVVGMIIILVFWFSSLNEKPTAEYVPLSKCFVKAPNIPLIPHIQILATITAYNPTKEQCDQDPDIMASGKRVYEGSVACPRELEFGTVVRIDGKWYVCEDRTSKRYDGRFDLLMFNKREAIEFGRQKKEVEIYK